MLKQLKEISILIKAFICCTGLILLVSHPAGASRNGFDPYLTSSAVGAIRDRVIIENFDSYFRGLSMHRKFNGNVLVGQQGAIIYEKSFGYSDLRLKNPLCIDSIFQIASVSKQFTAMDVMILHSEGKLDFDDPVSQYVPEFPYKGITIRHLLTHRSGLPDYMRFARKYRNPSSGNMTNNELLKIMIKYRPTAYFIPGQRYKYSNTGYAILAVIIEKISGTTYDVFMKNRIFDPLLMSNTFVYNPKGNNPAGGIAKGYSKNWRPVCSHYLDGVVGDKGIYSTVEDMFIWDQGLSSEKLVSHDTMVEAFTPSSYDASTDTEYGFGWRIKTLADGEKIFFHAGLWGGYNSLFIRRASDNTVIVVLSNRVNWSFCNIGGLMRMVDESSGNLIN